MRRAPRRRSSTSRSSSGPLREDGKHEVVTVLQRLDLGDRVAIAPAPSLEVHGFAGDTLVRDALAALAAAAGVEPGWRGDDREADPRRRRPRRRQLRRRRPRCGSPTRRSPRRCPPPSSPRSPRGSARTCRSSSQDGPQLGRGDGSELEPLDLPQDYWVVVALPNGAAKQSTAAVYEAFDKRDGAAGWTSAAALERGLARSGARATSLRSRRTISPPRRWRRSCTSSAPSAPTSRARARRSTASSTTAATRWRPGARSAAPPEPGSPSRPGTADRLRCGVDPPLTIEHGSTRFGRSCATTASARDPRRDRRRRPRPRWRDDWWVIVLLAIGAVAFYVSAAVRRATRSCARAPGSSPSPSWRSSSCRRSCWSDRGGGRRARLPRGRRADRPPPGPPLDVPDRAWGVAKR